MGLIAPGRPALASLVARSRRTDRPARAVGELLPLVGVQEDGLALLADGTVVRGYEVSPVNTLVLDDGRVEQLASQVHKLLARVPVDQTLSFYVHSVPLDAQRIVARETAASAKAAEALEARGEHALGEAMRRLGFAQAHSLLTHIPVLPASGVRYFVFCPYRPVGKARPPRSRRGQPAVWSRQRFDATVAEQARYAAAVLAGLKAMRLHAEPLTGVALADLLWARCSPSALNEGALAPSAQPRSIVGPLANTETADEAQARARSLKECLCREPLDVSGRGHLRWSRAVEQVVRLGSVPEETWLGWTQYLTLGSLPFTLAVHVHGRDRFRDKSANKRRYRQIWAANRGQERMGKLVDPDREDAEAEARDVSATLKRQAASSVYDVSVYLATSEPSGDLERLVEDRRNVCRELTSATDAVVNESPFAQLELWRATLPLGIDPPRRARKYLSINAADSFPLIGAGCGSPQSPTAIPLGYTQPSRELVWIDPFDPAHPNHVTVLAAQSGGGKTMLVNLLIGRAAAKGARGAIIDRSGHYDFAVSTIPGAASVRVGGGEGEHKINPWDGEPTAQKVAFLVALHELILGRPDDTGSALGKLEENLLGLAIRAVYRRCEQTGETPRETLLQEELIRRYREARGENSPELASVYQMLAESLHNYVGQGPYAWLCDHETTVAVDAPLVVYDTRRLPDSEAPAALFVICEQIIRRVESEREAFLAGDGEPGLPWAGRFFLVFEEVWKLIGPQSTGRWVNELARRSRHLALWLIAISQQLADFVGPQAQALISQSSLRLILHQNPDQLAFLREALGRSEQAVEHIRELRTVKREYSQAYVINGGRGEGTVTIAVSGPEYWRCTSDPISDEPLRRLAQRHAGQRSWRGAWRALKLLCNPAWHHQHGDTETRRR